MSDRDSAFERMRLSLDRANQALRLSNEAIRVAADLWRMYELHRRLNCRVEADKDA